MKHRMDNRRSLREKLSNWFPFVKQLYKDWEEAKNDVSQEDFEMRDRIWDKIHEEISPVRTSVNWYFRTAIGIAAAVALLLVINIFNLREWEGMLSDRSQSFVTHVYNGESVYVLPDGSKIWMEGGSCIKYVSDFNSCRDLWLTGNAVFDVVKNPESIFRVHMDSSCIEVKGTVFSVEQTNEKANVVTLYSGRIDYIGNKNETIKLNPSQRLVYNLQESSAQVIEFNSDIHWNNGRFRFVDVSLEDLVNFLGYEYGVDIDMDETVDRKTLLTGTFLHNEDEEGILSKIVLSLNLNCKKEDGKYVLSKKNE